MVVTRHVFPPPTPRLLALPAVITFRKPCRKGQLDLQRSCTRSVRRLELVIRMERCRTWAGSGLCITAFIQSAWSPAGGRWDIQLWLLPPYLCQALLSGLGAWGDQLLLSSYSKQNKAGVSPRHKIAQSLACAQSLPPTRASCACGAYVISGGLGCWSQMQPFRNGIWFFLASHKPAWSISWGFSQKLCQSSRLASDSSVCRVEM